MISLWPPSLNRRWDRQLSQRLHRMRVGLNWPQGVVSMTFDDAPLSAFERGGDLVRELNGHATYYCSLGLMNQPSPSGVLGGASHLIRAWSAGHELGCHTFDHLDAWSCDAPTFMASVQANAQAFDALIPGYRPRSFAYPKQGPRYPLKRALSSRFLACRGGRSDTHLHTVDLQLLRCVFLDRSRRPDASTLHRLIELTALHRGWLVLATHDVSHSPSVYGCHPNDLRYWLRCCACAGLRLLTVQQACSELQQDAGAGGRS